MNLFHFFFGLSIFEFKKGTNQIARHSTQNLKLEVMINKLNKNLSVVNNEVF